MNVSRTSRRNRTNKDVGLKTKGGIFDLVDNEIKTLYRINDEEYDYLAEHLTDQEISIFFKIEKLTYAEKRQCLITLEKYLTTYYYGKK